MGDRQGGPDGWPVPRIDTDLCDGCGLCLLTCPCSALERQADKAVVAHPALCDYCGLCEIACRRGAISRPFEIVVVEE